MGLGFDWDGDGKSGLFDDLVTLNVLEKNGKGNKPSGNKNKNTGGCGTYAAAVLAVPAVVIVIILKAKGVA